MEAEYPDLLRTLAKELKISDASEQQMIQAGDKFKSSFMQAIQKTE